MNYLKKVFSVILSLLAFITTMTVINNFRIHQIYNLVKDFEPVIIEQVEAAEPEPEVEAEVIAEPEPLPPRINCRLDDATQQMIFEKCEEYGIDFAFAMAVIFRESSFRPNADSGSSVGLMQINRINHGWLSAELGITDFFDPEQNVTAGLHMLRNLFDKYEDPAKVLMCYNMGENGAKALWDAGYYSTDYVGDVLQLADKYKQEIAERMGENDQM